MVHGRTPSPSPPLAGRRTGADRNRLLRPLRQRRRRRGIGRRRGIVAVRDRIGRPVRRLHAVQPATSVTSTDVHLTAVDDTWTLHPGRVEAGEPCMRLDGSGSTVAAPDTAIGPPFFECVGLPDASSTCSLLEGSTILCPASHTDRAAYTYEAPSAVAAGLEVPRDPNAPGVRPFAIVLEDGTTCMRGLTYQQGGLGWAETGYTCTPEDPVAEDMRLFLKTTPYDRLAQHPRWTLRQEGRSTGPRSSPTPTSRWRRSSRSGRSSIWACRAPRCPTRACRAASRPARTDGVSVPVTPAPTAPPSATAAASRRSR